MAEGRREGDSRRPSVFGDRQWETAFSAPAPVRERTSISAYFFASCSLDRTVPSQPRMNAAGIETMPGLLSGNQAKSTVLIIDVLLPDTAGENTISTIVMARPP